LEEKGFKSIIQSDMLVGCCTFEVSEFIMDYKCGKTLKYGFLTLFR